MALTWNIGESSFDIEPWFRLIEEPEYSADMAIVARNVRWELRITIFGDGEDDIKEGRDVFEAAAREPGVVHELREGEVAIATIDPDDCLSDPVLVMLTSIADDEEAARTGYIYSATVSARVRVSAGPIVSHEKSFRYDYFSNALERRTCEGRAEVARNEDVRDYLDEIIPETLSGAERSSREESYDQNYRKLKYVVVDEIRASDLPGGVTKGVVTNSRRQKNEAIEVEVSGEFFGDRALREAESHRPRGTPLIQSEVTEDPAQSKVSFRYAYLESASKANPDLIESAETYSFHTRKNVVRHKLLRGGLADYRQEVGSPDYVMIQEGRAVGKSRWPEVPAPVSSADICDQRVDYKSPEQDSQGARTKFTVEFRYEMVFSGGFPALKPERR
ncbi:MAG: hypothetical protein NUW37_20295 [Planctomycetes bacterium]|nr:hypothetical protein [Planctomycetota bacterium]